MDKTGNLKRNLLVTAIAITVIFGFAMVGYAVTLPQSYTASHQIYPIALTNGTSHSVNSSNLNVNKTDLNYIVGGTVNITVNISTNVGSNATNWTGIVGVANQFVNLWVTSDPWGTSAYNVSKWSGNLTNQGGCGTSAGGCNITWASAALGLVVKPWVWTTSTNATHLFTVAWDSTNLSVTSQDNARFIINVSNGTSVQFNTSLWLDIDNGVPAVAYNATGFATSSANYTPRNGLAAGGTLFGNFTITLNHTNINDPIFGTSNINTVWAKIQSAATPVTGGENWTVSTLTKAGGKYIYVANGTDGGPVISYAWYTNLTTVNNSWLAPGMHFVWWCANDTVNNTNCTTHANAPIYFMNVNATNLEEAVTVDSFSSATVLNISYLNGTNGTVGSSTYGDNFHFGSGIGGTEVLNISSNGGSMRSVSTGGTAGGSSNGSYGLANSGSHTERYNFTYTMLNYANETIEIVGLKLNTSLANNLHRLNSTNITEGLSQIEAAVTTNSSSQVTGIASHFVTVPLFTGMSNEEQQDYFLMGRVVFNTTYNSVFGCSGVGTCNEIYKCNATPSVFPNGTGAASASGLVFLNESGSALTSIANNGSCFQYNAGTTVVYSRHFSGFAAGNDSQSPTVNMAIADTAISPSETTDITCTATDYYNVYKIRIEVQGADVKTCNGTYMSSCSVTYDPPSTGTKDVNCYAVDRHFNQGQTSGTIAVASATGVGSAGGGATGASTTTTTHFTASEATTVDVGAETGIESIDIKSNKDAQDVQISTTKVNVKPATINSLSVEPVAIMEIKVTGLDIGDFEEDPAISFKIKNIQKPADTELALYRYAENAWTELPTETVTEDATYTHYKAVTPGFSYFAVAAVGATTLQDATAAPTATEIPMYVWYIVGAVVLAAVGLLVYYLYFKKR